MIFSFSTNVIFSLLINSFKNIDFTVSQNFRLSMTFFGFRSSSNRDMHKFLYFAQLSRSSSLLLFKYLFLRLVLFIISLLRVLFINRALLPLMYFFYGELSYLECFDNFSKIMIIIIITNWNL